MGKEDVLLIVNPHSGVIKYREDIIEAATRLCDSRGLRLNVVFTKGPGDASKLAGKAADEGYGKVVVAGGDGTIKDAADGLWRRDTALGIIPMGSGNGVGRSLGVPQVEEKALETALGSNYIMLDRGLANGDSFYSAFGVGLDAEISYRFSLDKKRGKSTYIKHALKEIFKYKPRKFRLLTGGNEISTEAMLVAVCNCKQYGNNAYIAPKADPADGELDVTVVHAGNFFAKLVAGIDLFSGNLDHNILVKNFKVSEIEIIDEDKGESLITHLDGEPFNTSSNIKIGCEKNGLKIAVPGEVQPFRPYVTPMLSMMEDLVLDIKKNLHSGKKKVAKPK